MITMTNSKYWISYCEDAPTANASIDKANVVIKILKILSNLRMGSSTIKSL